MPGTVVFVLDGVLALPRKRRHHIEKQPPDWRAYFDQNLLDEDAPNRPMVALCQQLAETNEIILITERPIGVSEVTCKWLKGTGIPFDHIIWRQGRVQDPVGDYKITTMETLQSDGWRPWLIIDDDPVAAATYQRMGVCALYSVPNA